MSASQPEWNHANYEGFARACELVCAALDGGVTYEWPGCIAVQVLPRVELWFGLVNETISGNVNVLRGDLWDTTEEGIETSVPCSEPDAQVMADAIIAAVREYTRGDDASARRSMELHQP